MSKTLKHVNERKNFHALKLLNPNYFGNISGSAFQPILPLIGDTFYEDLSCLGFQPQLGRLEAVVTIKQPGGYNGDLCSTGSVEYVRFFLSFDGGSSWVDQGMASFTAHDTGTSEPLEYDVTLAIPEQGPFCVTPSLPKVRAILSWNNPPTAGDPNFTPIWGKVVDAHIQLEPTELIIFEEALKAAKVSEAAIKQLSQSLDLAQPLPSLPKEAASLADLHAAYKGKVPQLRMLFPTLTKLMHAPAPAAAEASALHLKSLGIDVAKALQTLQPLAGDTSFEQLTCVGYNLDAAQLVGTIVVKQPNGYSGGLCSSGSPEYVNFWVNWGAGWTFIGSTSVTVHDIESIPSDGLRYSVFLPWNPIDHQQPCAAGLNRAQVRGVLSWATMPSTTDPDAPPFWGNRVDSYVQIRPGDAVAPGVHPPAIDTLGGMSPLRIDGNGIANGASTFPAPAFTALDSPFGGDIEITGQIAYPGASVGSLLYRVRVTPLSGPPQTFNNSFPLTVRQLIGGVWTPQNVITQSPSLVTDPALAVPDYFYPYQVFQNGSTQQFVTGNVLFEWPSSAVPDGLYTLTIDVLDPVAHVLYPPIASTVAVRVNNTGPADPMLEISSGGGNCADFHIGDVLFGVYSAID